MSTTVLFRLAVALCCVLMPLWLMAQMPSESAFAIRPAALVAFDFWQGAILASGLVVSAVTARFLARS